MAKISLNNWSGWPQTWKAWNTRGFLWTWKTHGILCNLRDNWLCTLGAACVKQSICNQVYLMHKNCWF